MATQEWRNANQDKMRDYRREWYHRNKDEQRAIQREKQKERNNGIRAYVRELKEASPCADCNTRYPYYVMQFDHLDSESKIDSVSRLATYSMKKVVEEIAKCELVCANCHAERTHSRRMDVA